jgi:hypothetical protein
MAGVDAAGRRIVLILDAPDARSAAIAQADIQASVRPHRVILVRPVAVNLPVAAQVIANAFGKSVLEKQDIDRFQTQSEDYAGVLQNALGLAARHLTSVPVAWTVQVFAAMQQLSLIQFHANAGHESPATTGPVVDGSPFRLDLATLMAADPIALDRDLGVCGFPLYSLSESEVELIQTGSTSDAIVDCLKTAGVFQYFYPPTDHLALAMVEHGVMAQSDLLSSLRASARLGHPFGDPEIVGAQKSILDTIGALHDKKLLAEAEIGFVVTETGQELRGTVRLKPREGLVSKILAKLSVSIDLVRLFRGGA